MYHRLTQHCIPPGSLNQVSSICFSWV